MGRIRSKSNLPRMYYRLLKETDREIILSDEGIEIPGAECVHIELIYKDETEDEIPDSVTLEFDLVITFEDERRIVLPNKFPVLIPSPIKLEKSSKYVIFKS